MNDKQMIDQLRQYFKTRGEAMYVLDLAFPPKWGIARDEAEEFLLRELKVGRHNKVRMDVLRKKAEKLGIRYRTLRRASIGLIDSHTEGYGKNRRSYWWLVRK